MDWLTNASSVEEVPNFNWFISVFPGTKKNDGGPYPGFKSWEHPVKELGDLMKKSCKLNGSLVFFPYRWIYGLKQFS